MIVMRGFLDNRMVSPASLKARDCPCGRGPRRPDQRTCKQCHAEDMRDRRARATAAGTYTLRSCRRLEP